LKPFGERNIPSVDTLVLSRRCAVSRIAKVTSRVRWTASLDAVDDMPVAGVANPVSRSLICHCQLARAAAVNRSVLAIRAEIELESERRPSLHALTCHTRQRHTVAREVAAIKMERIFRCRPFDGLRGSHEHMCRCERWKMRSGYCHTRDGAKCKELHSSRWNTR